MKIAACLVQINSLYIIYIYIYIYYIPTSFYILECKEPGTRCLGKDDKTAFKPPVIKVYTQGAKKLGPGPPLQILAANKWPILLMLPSATLTIPQYGSYP